MKMNKHANVYGDDLGRYTCAADMQARVANRMRANPIICTVEPDCRMMKKLLPIFNLQTIACKLYESTSNE
jgi:hypothetical protein